MNPTNILSLKSSIVTIPSSVRRRVSFALLVLLTAVPVFAQNQPSEIVFDRCLVIGQIGEFTRNALHTDAVEALIVSGAWTAPQDGQTVKTPGGESKWGALQADKDGWFDHEAFRGGYASIVYKSDVDRTMLLDAVGHNLVYVNGEPRTGDRYSSGMTLIPVHLRQGDNEFLFLCSRGRFKAKLVAPDAPVILNVRDNTLPDLIIGEKTDSWGAIVVINTTQQALKDLSLWVKGDNLKPTLTSVPDILPLGIRKVGFRLQGDAPQKEQDVEALILLTQMKDSALSVLDSAAVKLRVRRPDQSRKRTFVSEIDGSVQYFGVQPAHPAASDKERPALFLSLHGAGVDAIGQADSYNNKSWGYVVAPTNRRPYGFDWEDWGRLDALEVLELAQQEIQPDPQRVYLAGHSMGGHGTWQIGVLFPDRFAAIAPSAGWCSFWSYADAKEAENPNPMDIMLKRSVATSDTLSLSRNYLHESVYILHGDADDNVPISEARQMKEHLLAFHRDLDGHEQPGAGHWWDRSDEPGADCLDWQPLFDFFAKHRIPRDSEIRQVEFAAANPGVSSRCHWLNILAQSHQLQPATACIRFDPGKSRFTGTTHNIARLSLDLQSLNPAFPILIQLDGDAIQTGAKPSNEPSLYLERKENHWFISSKPSLDQKGHHRYGPFKDAFRHNMIFVYGTTGNAEENAWALAKARCDAEEFWYRGNGSIQVIPDVEFNPEKEKDRGVILYGNADTNAAWKPLLSNSPVQVGKNSISLDGRTLTGENLCCLFLQPRPGSDVACVAAISGTGLPGMRLAERLPYFVSGVGYPDCIVMGTEVLSVKSEGVRAAGFFGLDWSVKNGEFAWKE